MDATVHARVVGFQQVLLPVTDIERATRFYGELLGLERVRAEGDCLWFTASSGAAIMLHGPHGQEPVTPAPGQAMEIWLEVRGVDALAERLRAAGLEVQGPVDEHWGERVAGVRDPDGYRVYLAEPGNRKA